MIEHGSLPSFLQPFSPGPGDPPSVPAAPTPWIPAVFQHKFIPSFSQSLWWPSSDPCDTCLIFIPGNPGLVEFYTPFLTAIHEKCLRRLCIFAHAHVGHATCLDKSYQDSAAIHLTSQVQATIEAVDAARTDYRKIILIGHSVGAWIVLQALKERQDIIDSIFLLFPTITHIVRTPNGRQLAWAFGGPLPRLISWLSVATRLIPSFGLRYLYPDWPDQQLAVLRSLLDSPKTVYACLTMAREEMATIKELDVQLLQRNKHILHLYLAEVDSWVGGHKTTILEAFQPDEGNVKIVHGPEDIPHAFCINHGEELAEQCHKWLGESGIP